MGGLFVSGWTVDDVLDLSWDQLHVVASCVAEYRAIQMEIILDVISSSLGGKVKKKPTAKQKEKPKKNVDASFAALGLKINTVKGQ